MQLAEFDTSPPVFQGMVGGSEAMQAVFRDLRRAARSEINVLLRGESGTGKDLAARALHRMGRRAQAPFQAVNCATFTPEMLASRLFGHVKGAFTGAISDRQGLLHAADGGTLFLDELAEIPLPLQGRLLRVLQDGWYTPVGGTRERKADVRLISATNASLRDLVERRLFREDLMYRVRVVILHLPPLRDRGEDLDILTAHIVRRLNVQEERTIERISPAAWEAMRAHGWPGNIRELENVLAAAFVLGEGPELTLDELSPELRGEGPRVKRRAEEAPPTIEGRERDRLLEVWDRHGGRREPMAEELGISRSTLYRKLRHHGLL